MTKDELKAKAHKENIMLMTAYFHELLGKIARDMKLTSDEYFFIKNFKEINKGMDDAADEKIDAGEVWDAAEDMQLKMDEANND